MDGFGFCESRKSLYKYMSATKDIDDNGVDQSIHSDDMFVDMFFEVFQIVVVEVDCFESLCKKFGIYTVMKVRRFLLFFEKIEHRYAIVFEENEEHNSNNTDNNKQ